MSDVYRERTKMELCGIIAEMEAEDRRLRWMLRECARALGGEWMANLEARWAERMTP